MHYDIIGDFHGHVNNLRELLEKMGYGVSEQGYNITQADNQFLWAITSIAESTSGRWWNW